VSNYTLDEIIKRWGKGKLTTEQAIGQILLLLQSLSQRVGQLERQAEIRRQEQNEHNNG
jgi:hypothetical protein